MDRWRQYGVLGGLLATCLALGLWGFRATGGALPYAKRFSLALQRGAETGSGSLVDLARGIVVAGPIRKGGLVGEYAAVVLLLLLVGVGLYVYVERNADSERNGTGSDQDRERTA
ncbi:cobalamin transport operon protein [Haloparvum sp. AD34]